jgi:hypothetical protein
VLGKARIPTHRGNGSAEQPTVGLSVDRLALVERYMIDAEEAEARAQSAPASIVRPDRRAVAQRADDETAELPRANRELPQPAAEDLQVTAEQPLREVRRPTLHVDETGVPPLMSTAKQQEARSRKAVAKADKRAAKHAARVVAALEKKEARERKALAKAAARREAQARKALGKSIAR